MTASVNFKRQYSIKQLENTFDTYIKSNTAVGIDKMTYKCFCEKKDESFELINKKVISGTYKFTPYKEKLIIKSRKSYPRLISIPTIRDKVVLKALHLALAETFDDIMQPLPQKCIEDIKSSLHKFDSFIKLDISNFYGSIKHGILIDKLKKKIKKPEVLSLISKAITTVTVSSGDSRSNEIITEGIPQGLAISNILAHIYLKDLDLKFKNKKNLEYVRYVDDIIILCSEKNIKKIYEEIRYELEGIYNLNINLDKTKLGSIEEVGFDFLGYSVKTLGTGGAKLTVKEVNRKRFEDSIVKIFARYKHSNVMSPEQFIFTLNNKISGAISSKVSGDVSKEFKYGWLFYFSQIEDTGILYHLDWFIVELITKFNLSHIDGNSIKSFVKAFYEIKYNLERQNISIDQMT
ncbi:reverse transcriptase domain-containing protein [Bacillus thuringiensis]